MIIMVLFTRYKISPTTRVEEAEALQKQSNYKLEKHNILKKVKPLAATGEYIQSLVLVEQYSPTSGLKNVEQVEKRQNNLMSETARIELMKQ